MISPTDWFDSRPRESAGGSQSQNVEITSGFEARDGGDKTPIIKSPRDHHRVPGSRSRSAVLLRDLD